MTTSIVKISETLQQGHDAFEREDFDKAMLYFDAVKKASPELEDVLDYLLSVCRNNAAIASTQLRMRDEEFQKKRISERVTHLNPKLNMTSGSPSIIVIFHIFHEEVVDLCLDRISLVTHEFDLLVTTPLPQDHPAIQKVYNRFPKATVIRFENAGRDIGPFIRCWAAIQRYDLCCKIHTKKGVSDYISTWRSLCLDGILESELSVQHIVHNFADNPDLALAGSELLFGSYKELVGNNSTNVTKIIKTLQLAKPRNKASGFFMGTMFWMRPAHFGFIKYLQELVFVPEASQKDGMQEHAIERMFGTLLLDDKKVLLSRGHVSKANCFKTVDSDYTSSVTSFHQHFEAIDRSYKSLTGIVGHFSCGGEFDRTLSGWLALRGDDAPREAMILIDGSFEIDIICNKYRADLQKNGINRGTHAFQVTIPFQFTDGLPHEFKLLDKITGKTVFSSRHIKHRNSEIDVIRAYDHWNIIKEKQFLHFMDSVPLKTAQPLVSVIMPTYNRYRSISNAINSVLMQSYQNFELIIIDDGSSDDTGLLLARCYTDQRIKYTKTLNEGVSAARNLGIRKSEGSYIFFLDSDNYWNKNFLSTMTSYMSSMNLDSAYCGMKAIDDRGELTHYKGCDFSWQDCLHSNYVDLNTFGFRAQLHSPKPLFNVNLKRLVDWDYILRISQYKTISYAPFLGVIYYDGNQDRITNTINKSPAALLDNIEAIVSQFRGYKRSLNDSDYTYASLALHAEQLSSKPIPSIDTIITSFNHSTYIAQAIDSVICQTGDFKHRIIISDDGSTDNTREIIKQYAHQYPHLILDISSEVNLGLSSNMKRCIEASQGNFVAICEGDDYWTDPRKLAKSARFLQLNENHSMVFNQINIQNTSTGKFGLLSRQFDLPTQSLTGQDFINEPTMNLIGNFSCCLFNGPILRSLPKSMYKTRLNEIAVAFYFDTHGRLGFLREPMSVYRQHSGGLWTGSDRLSQLKSGMAARQMAFQVARSIYRPQIRDIVENQYRKPLSKLHGESKHA
jgi:glycosyltransferase involved in cell wall biosynthesis